ncbi:MAG: hypothetical protein H6Q70_1942 [Firmicutes bacterium]|nr:hypothetical protein [Bacillota bacterium]
MFCNHVEHSRQFTRNVKLNIKFRIFRFYIDKHNGNLYNELVIKSKLLLGYKIKQNNKVELGYEFD